MRLMQKKLMVVCVGSVFISPTIVALCDAPPAVLTPGHAATRFMPLGIPGVQNVFRLNSKLISGSAPEGEAAFKALKSLGVKTVITVDGARPDVKTAKKYGLLYVQIPFGYDDLPRGQALIIARAVRDLPGPIYLHCHHGKHRGPVAASCAMIAIAGWSNADALAFLKRAGTGANYTGLWDSVRRFQAPAVAELNKAPRQYSANAPTPPLVQTMVKLDQLNESLKALQSAKWGILANHPGADAPHDALMLREIFTELKRTRETARRPADFRAWLTQGEADAAALEAALRANNHEKADAASQKITATCASCHAVYRNVPQIKAGR